MFTGNFVQVAGSVLGRRRGFESPAGFDGLWKVEIRGTTQV